MDLIFFETEMRMPAGMVILPVRCTVVRTSKGSVVISPIPFTDAQAARIHALAPVSDLVSPCLIHHLSMPRAIARFPGAKVWGVPGCREKLPAIPWQGVFTRDFWPHDDELRPLLIGGTPKMNETVFLHVASKTLIVADFAFNLTRPKGWAAPVMLRLLGTHGRFAVSRLQLKFLEDRQAFQDSVRRLLEWDFDRIVMGHGDVIERDGKNLLTRALLERGLLPA